MQKSKDNPKLSGKTIACAPISNLHFLYSGKNQFAPGCELCFPWISWSHAPNLHFLGKTWVRIVFSLGFHGLRSPKPAFLGKTKSHLGAHCVFPWFSWAQKPQTCIYLEKNLYSHLGANCNLHSLWQKPIGNLGWGVGVVGWWGGGLCISNDLKQTFKRTVT